jgi:hypothetical protein
MGASFWQGMIHYLSNISICDRCFQSGKSPMPPISTISDHSGTSNTHTATEDNSESSRVISSILRACWQALSLAAGFAPLAQRLLNF